jgi:hypothetical protein
MPQNYAKLSFMNSDNKEVTCVCDTVLHVRPETSQLLSDRFCLSLQTEGKGQSNVVDHLDRGFVCRLSKYVYKGYLRPKDPPLSVLTAAFHLKKETYISQTLCFFYHNILSKISTITKCKISFSTPILRRLLRIRIGFLIECDVRLTERNGQSECIW